MKTIHDFLPISKEDLLDREWYYYDFLLITGDAYVDHPSFGTAIISRVLEDLGFRVAILAQPDWKNVDSFTALGKPRYGVLVNGGNIDSMVAHYTAARKRRHDDAYSPGRKAGLRPARAQHRAVLPRVHGKKRVLARVPCGGAHGVNAALPLQIGAHALFDVVQFLTSDSCESCPPPPSGVPPLQG